MFKNLLQNLNQKKVKVFSLFLGCSFFAWFVSNLSDSYESRCDFDIHYRNLPDTMLLGKNAINSMEAKLRTSGFQFLYYNFFTKRLDIDVSEASYQNGQYIIPQEVLKKQIDRQLSQNISLLDLDRRRLVVDLYQVASREIPISPNLDIEFQQNFILDGPLEVTPAMIVAKGPESEIDTLRQIETVLMELKNVSDDFELKIPLELPRGLDNTIYSDAQVLVSGKVAKFSEEVFTLPIQVINSPEGYRVKTFPNTVSVLCKATLDRLKEISQSDFEVVADYSQVGNSSQNTIYLEMQRTPLGIFDVRLQEKTVNFVLEQQ